MSDLPEGAQQVQIRHSLPPALVEAAAIDLKAWVADKSQAEMASFLVQRQWSLLDSAVGRWTEQSIEVGDEEPVTLLIYTLTGVALPDEVLARSSDPPG